MAVLAIFTGEGLTKQMYDDAGTLHVAKVWESVEAMNAFVGTRLIPGFTKLGIPVPAVSVFPARNVNVYPAATQFLLK